MMTDVSIILIVTLLPLLCSVAVLLKGKAITYAVGIRNLTL